VNSKFRIRWALIGCIWLTTLGFTAWNLAKIDAVAAGRIENENLRREIHFQRHNAQRLEQVAARRQALFMEVESLDLGMVALRYRLRALAAAFHLEGLALEVEANENADDRVPCRLSLTGRFENTVGFLTALNEYPYLVPRQSLIAAAENNHTVRVEMAFFVQFKIVAQAAPAEPLPKLTNQALEAQGRPL
jgi:Tfp pilus assembly protein PilO